MTPEQLALAQLRAAEWQAWLTAVAIVLGPLAGVLFTLWFQRHKERQDAKHRLFATLMTHRRSPTPPPEWVHSLNLIDLVFADEPEVVRLWHEYYDLLSQDPVNGHLTDSKYLDLLAAMAKTLGFRRLSQTDINKFYSPRFLGHQQQQAAELQSELLRVLKNTGHISTSARSE